MNSTSFDLEIKNKINPYKKNIKVDSDKSISIRSFIIGAISQNISIIKNVLESDDVLSTIQCQSIPFTNGEILNTSHGLASSFR